MIIPDDIAVEIKNVHEKYDIEIKFEQKTIRESFEALKDISFTIQKGEAVAIIGPNGAGKSTLLRLMAGLLKPEKGAVKVHGRVSSLLDLGAGFHPELTGRDNLLLNASLYNFTRDEINGKLQQIIEFSEIGKFVDVPVRCYSQGMYVRLAFSLAIHVDPDILLIDDCLAVGDDNFRLKSVDKVLELKSRKKTIIFVTHDFGTARQVCDRGIYLREGRILHDGGIQAVIASYVSPLSVDQSRYKYLGMKLSEEASRRKAEEERHQQEEAQHRKREEEKWRFELGERLSREEQDRRKEEDVRRCAETDKWRQEQALALQQEAEKRNEALVEKLREDAQAWRQQEAARRCLEVEAWRRDEEVRRQADVQAWRLAEDERRHLELQQWQRAELDKWDAAEAQRRKRDIDAWEMAAAQRREAEEQASRQVLEERLRQEADAWRKEEDVRRSIETEQWRQEQSLAWQEAEAEKSVLDTRVREVAEFDRRRLEMEAWQQAEELRQKMVVEQWDQAEAERRRLDVEAWKRAEDERRQKEAEAWQQAEELRQKMAVEQWDQAEVERRRLDVEAWKRVEDERRQKETEAWCQAEAYQQKSVSERWNKVEMQRRQQDLNVWQQAEELRQKMAVEQWNQAEVERRRLDVEARQKVVSEEWNESENKRRQKETETWCQAEELRQKMAVEQWNQAEVERRRLDGEAWKSAEDERRQKETETRCQAEELRQKMAVEQWNQAEVERRRLDGEAWKSAEDERRRLEMDQWRKAEEARQKAVSETWNKAEELRQRLERRKASVGKVAAASAKVLRGGSQQLFSNESLRAMFRPWGIQLFDQDVEVIQEDGLRTFFDKNGVKMSSADAVWRIRKGSDAAVVCYIRWRKPVPFFQVWRFSLLDDGAIHWEVLMKTRDYSSIDNARAECCSRTPFNIVDRDRLGIKSTHVYCADSGLVFETLRKDQVCGISNPVKNVFNAYFLTVKGLDCPTVPLVSEKWSCYFSGKLFIQKKMPVVKGVDLVSRAVGSGKLKVNFEEGACRLLWGRQELTTGLGLYTSIFSQGVWYDSRQARWQVESAASQHLKVRGSWPWLPVLQAWDIVVEDKNTISLACRMQVCHEVHVQIQEAVLMLSDAYQNWRVDKEVKDFTAGFSRDDFFRMCLWAMPADGKNHVAVLSKGLPAVTFNPDKLAGYRIIVENAGHVNNTAARLFHCLKVNKDKDVFVQPGTYEFFRGQIKINPEEAL